MIPDTKLSRRQSLFALTCAAAFGPFALAGCGGGSGKSGANNTGGKSVSGQAKLPVGLSGRAAQMRLYTGVGDTALAADGKFTVNTLADMPTLATLMDNDKPALVGFLDTQAQSNTLDSNSCAIALLFFALGGQQFAPEQRRSLIALIAANAVTSGLAQAIDARLNADPYALVNQDAQIVTALNAAIQSLVPATAKGITSSLASLSRSASGRSAAQHSSAQTALLSGSAPPTPFASMTLRRGAGKSRATRADDLTPLLLLTPAGLINGMETVQDGDLQPGFSVINHQRRVRRVHLYRVGVVDQAGAETRYPTAVAVGDPLIVVATQNLSLLNALGDVLNATTPWSPVQSSRVALPLEANTQKTEYEIVTLSSTFNTSEPAFFGEARYGAEAPKWRAEIGDLNESAYFELCFGILLEALGMGGLKYSEAAFGQAIANVKNVGGNDIASLLARARGGDPAGASILAFIQLVVSSDIVSTRYLTAITPIYRIANAQLAADAQVGALKAQPLQRFRSALRVLAIVGLLASGLDIGAQIRDLSGGDKGNLYTADVYIPSVRLNPASSTISAGDSVTFSASVPGAVGANLIFAWSLSGSNLANLSDSATGKAGMSFETPGKVVTLATTPSTVGTLTVSVEAFATQNNGSRKSLGTATGTVKIQDDVPQGTVKIVFNSLNANGAPITGETRRMNPFQTPLLSQYQGNPVVREIYQQIRSTGYDDGLRLEMWFDTSTVKVGTQVSFGPGKNSSLALKLANGNGTDTNFVSGGTGASGTLTVTEVSNPLLDGYIKFTVQAHLTTSDPAQAADVTITGSVSGISDRL